MTSHKAMGTSAFLLLWAALPAQAQQIEYFGRPLSASPVQEEAPGTPPGIGQGIMSPRFAGQPDTKKVDVSLEVQTRGALDLPSRNVGAELVGEAGVDFSVLSIALGVGVFGEGLTGNGRAFVGEVYGVVSRSVMADRLELGATGFLDFGLEASGGFNLQGRYRLEPVELRLSVGPRFAADGMGYGASVSVGRGWELSKDQGLSLTGRLSAGAPRFEAAQFKGDVVLTYHSKSWTFGLDGSVPVASPVAPSVGAWVAYAFF
ncbi:hypothetical protein NR798_46805 [Archangium gephyra]|uniref:hypothetical protein n=1 Tax=Archangium gephyra TaxID=48 RepID=UPI0035D47631